MSQTTLSVAEMLANLEARIAHHRERKTFHAEQEVHHRERAAFHEAELQHVLQRYETFKAAAEAVGDYAVPPAAPAPPPAAEVREEETIPRFGSAPMVSRLIARVTERQKEGEEFGPRRIAAEVNRRYGDKLPQPVTSATVSVVLRRLRQAGRIHVTRKGKAAHESLYVRGPRPARPS